MKKLIILITFFIAISSVFAQNAEERMKIKLKYRRQIGNLWMDASGFQFNKFNYGEVRTDTIGIFNALNVPMTFEFDKSQNYIQMHVLSDSLGAKEEGKLVVHVDGKKIKEYGRIYKRVNITTNDSLKPRKKIGVNFTIVEDFSKWTPEQLVNAPIIKFEKLKMVFDNIKSGENVVHNYKFTNIGKTDLTIRKVKGS